MHWHASSSISGFVGAFDKAYKQQYKVWLLVTVAIQIMKLYGLFRNRLINITAYTRSFYH